MHRLHDLGADIVGGPSYVHNRRCVVRGSHQSDVHSQYVSLPVNATTCLAAAPLAQALPCAVTLMMQLNISYLFTVSTPTQHLIRLCLAPCSGAQLLRVPLRKAGNALAADRLPQSRVPRLAPLPARGGPAGQRERRPARRVHGAAWQRHHGCALRPWGFPRQPLARAAASPAVHKACVPASRQRSSLCWWLDAADESLLTAQLHLAGSVTMRYQPDPEDPLSFFDVRGAARVSVLRH